MKPWAWAVVTASLGTAAYLLVTGGVPSLYSPRERLLRLARAELGKSDGYPYWEVALGHPRATPSDWCGAFVLWAIKKAFGVPWLWEDQKGFLYRLPRTLHPKPGDLGYADNGYNHQGIIESVNTDGTITSIDGNSWFGQVRRNVRPASFWTAFYDIEPLIQGDFGPVQGLGSVVKMSRRRRMSRIQRRAA